MKTIIALIALILILGCGGGSPITIEPPDDHPTLMECPYSGCQAWTCHGG